MMRDVFEINEPEPVESVILNKLTNNLKNLKMSLETI